LAQLVRSQTLYPTELRGRNEASFTTIYLSLHLARLAALAAPQFSTPQQISRSRRPLRFMIIIAPATFFAASAIALLFRRCSFFGSGFFAGIWPSNHNSVIAGKLGCAGAGASDSTKFSVATNTTNC